MADKQEGMKVDYSEEACVGKSSFFVDHHFFILKMRQKFGRVISAEFSECDLSEAVGLNHSLRAVE